MDKLVENILKVYNVATDTEKAEGLSWYADARKVCARLAKKYKQPLEVVCYVTAALSPNNKWQRNLIDTEKVLALHVSGELHKKVTAYQCGDIEALRGIASTYTVNLIKAYSIIETRDFSYLGKGLKTHNFAKNIFLVKKDDNVTIDFHAFSIATDFRHTVKSIKSTAFRPKQYHEIANAYREAGKLVGIQPKQMQAITWVAWRRVDKVK